MVDAGKLIPRAHISVKLSQNQQVWHFLTVLFRGNPEGTQYSMNELLNAGKIRFLHYTVLDLCLAYFWSMRFCAGSLCEKHARS